MGRFSAIGVVAFALGALTMGCAAEAYQQPVQTSVQGRASLMAIPPSEPAPFTTPPPVAYTPPPPQAAPAPTTQTASTQVQAQVQAQAPATNQAGPLPALPSQAPRYTPPPPPAPTVVYRSYPVYYGDYYSPYYYRSRPTFYTGFSVGQPYYRQHHHHRVGVGFGWGF